MNTERTLAKLRVFSSFTRELASLSTCKRRRVGAIVFPPDFTEVLAIGYNGPPQGSPNNGCTEIEGGCGCVHAEANTTVKLFTERRDLVMLTTCFPCHHCAGLIANCRQVSMVIYDEEYRDTKGLATLEQAGKLVLPLIGEEERLCKLLWYLRRT